MRKFRVAIIGTGMAFERLHYPAYQELKDKFEIVALCDSDLEKARTWGQTLGISPENLYSDFHPMVTRQDIDVIDIMVPIELNYAVTEAVAKAIAHTSKAIITEKPLAATLEQAEAHRRLPEKYGIPILVAENYRYNEEIDQIRDMVRNKRIGEVVYFLQNRVMCFPEDMKQDKFAAKEWRQHPEFPGGVFLDTGVHDLAALRHIFGAIDQVHAFGRPQQDDYSPYAAINVNILFHNGITGQYTFYPAGKEMQRPFVGLRIFGTQGEIFLEERDCGTINIAYNNGTSEQIPYRPQRGYYNELLNLYNTLMGTEPISVTPELEFGDALTVFAILRSLKEGMVATVDRDFAYQPAYPTPGPEIHPPLM